MTKLELAVEIVEVEARIDTLERVLTECGGRADGYRFNEGHEGKAALQGMGRWVEQELINERSLLESLQKHT